MLGEHGQAVERDSLFTQTENHRLGASGHQ